MFETENVVHVSSSLHAFLLLCFIENNVKVCILPLHPANKIVCLLEMLI